MKRKTILLILYAFCSTLNAQESWQSLKGLKAPATFHASSILYRLGRYHASGAQDVLNKVTGQRIVQRADRRIYVEIAYGNIPSIPIDIEMLRDAGLEINTVWKNSASCWIDIGDIMRVSEELPDTYFMQPVRIPRHDDEGPYVMNSDSYIGNGADGSGIKVAIIDYGYVGLSEAVSLGLAPGDYDAYDWTGGGLETEQEHGTACVETVFDHAPGASYQIHKINSSPSDFGNAIATAVYSGVNIISHSLSWYNRGWGDNTGPICAAVAEATDSGILFFTSAGNRNGQHWQGNFQDANSNNWHEWASGDEENFLTIYNEGEVSLYLQWNNEPILDCYDLHLYDYFADTVLESSTNVTEFEEIHWENTTGSSMVASVRLVHIGSGTPEFELFHHSDDVSDFLYSSISGSTTCPSNSSEPNCLSIAAVDFEEYFAPDGSDVIESYSSLGPTNDGNQAPDMAGPTNTTTFAYNGAFGGTSCATPNAAGATAAFWSGHPYLSALGVRQILLKKALLYNDWGDAGIDNTYGSGGLKLFEYQSPTRYIDKDAGNTGGSPDRPYYNMEQADTFAPANAWVVFLGGIYPAVPGYIFDKPLIYRSIIQNALVK